jgi:hypothetical protein
MSGSRGKSASLALACIGLAVAVLSLSSVAGSARTGAVAEQTVTAIKENLAVKPHCGVQQWPDVQPDCLVRTDGKPLRAARTITIGHQEGEATTVLVRMPAPLVASR